MTISPNTEGRFGVLGECDVFWGSHGCDLKYGHDGLCVCGDEETGLCMAAPADDPAWLFFGADAEERGYRIWKHKTFAWYWLPHWKGLLLTFYRWELWLGFPHFWHTERNWGHFNKKMAKSTCA